MAPRPIVWSLGIAGITGLLALNHANNLALDTKEEAALAVARPERPAGNLGERRSLTISADYRGQYIVHPSIDNYRVRMMVDTVAAGDSFVGAFAAALQAGFGFSGALQRGLAAGSLACTVAGAQPSVPRREAIEALVGQSFL